MSIPLPDSDSGGFGQDVKRGRRPGRSQRSEQTYELDLEVVEEASGWVPSGGASVGLSAVEASGTFSARDDDGANTGTIKRHPDVDKIGLGLRAGSTPPAPNSPWSILHGKEGGVSSLRFSNTPPYAGNGHARGSGSGATLGIGSTSMPILVASATRSMSAGGNRFKGD